MDGIIKAISNRLLRSIALIIVVVFAFTGCTDELKRVMDEATTATEAKLILGRASEVRADPEVANPLPVAYRRPPEILQTSKGWKVFYYTRNHAPNVVAGLVRGQLNNNISVSNETNQLIIDCKDQDDVEQVLAYLENVDVPPIQVKIDCIIVEHYADVTMDRETRVRISELFGEDIVFEGARGDGWGLFPGASVREEKRSDFGMSIGWDSDDVRFLVDMLVSRGYLKVLMNPSVETITGSAAHIMAKDQVPTFKIVNERGRDPYTLTEYVWIEDSLRVVPEVYADGSVSLSAEATLSSKNTPEGVAQLPIITERRINLGQSRLRPGQSLVVGGFRKSEQSSVMRGFPVLKDIPIIGALFSSRDFEERAKEVTFILTPSVSSGGIPYGDMLERIAQDRMPHSDPNHIGTMVRDAIMDPLGRQARTRELEEQREAETIQRLRFEIETARTDAEAQMARDRLEDYQTMIAAEKAVRERSRTQLEQHKQKIAEIEDLKVQLKEHIERQKQEHQAALKEVQDAADTTTANIERKQKLAQEAEAKLNEQQQMLEKLNQTESQIKQSIETMIEHQKTIRDEIEALEKEVAESENDASKEDSDED